MYGAATETSNDCQDLKTPSSVERLNYYGTLQLGEYELPLYQISDDQLRELQLQQIDPAISISASGAAISKVISSDQPQNSPLQQ